MKNKLIVTLTITTLICTACGKAPTTENKTSNITTETTQAGTKENNGKDEQQFQIMSKQIEQVFDKSPEDFPYLYYTVTDLDQNGRLELILSSGMQGTSLFTYSQIYEISEDGTELKNYTKNEELTDDIVDGIDRAYYDKKTDTYYFVTKSLMRDGIAESGASVKALSLKNGKITSDFISGCYAHHDFDTNKTEEEYCKYVNGEKKKVTAKEYNPEKIEKEYFQGMKKKKVKISWGKFKKKLKEESVVELLKTSYKKFQLN